MALKSIDTTVPPLRAALSDQEERALLVRIAEKKAGKNTAATTPRMPMSKHTSTSMIT